MADWTNKCFIIILGIIIAESNGQPQILNIDDDEYIIHSGDNFSILCHGVKQLSWNYPQSNGTHVESISSNHRDFPFASNLTIYNASYENVGFYNCSEIGNLYEKPAQVYMYVEDEEILSVFNSVYESINAVEDSEIIIPCRPTSPDVKVELYTSVDNNKIDLKYDPKIGFFYFVKSIYDQDDYICNFTRGNVNTSVTYFVLVAPVPTYIAVPYIEDMNHGHTVVGKNLTLKCTVKHTYHNISFKWLLPNKNRRIFEKMDSEEKDNFFSNLTISDATKDDKGQYTCLVSDGRNQNNNTKEIPVFDLDENFINLYEENNVINISVSAGEPSVLWRIEVDAHPIEFLVLTWLDNKNNEILGDTKSKKYETNVTSRVAILKINSVAISDFGTYTLIAKNEFAEKNLSLSLHVTDKPSVAIHTDNYHLLWKNSTIKCATAGYPEPKIYWKFKPCMDYSCEFENIVEDNVKHMGLQIISEVKIYANKSGYISCSATNELGTDTATTGFYVTDINKNGFNVWTSDNVLNQVNISKVAKQETVELYCAVSIYNYTNDMMWFKNGLLINADDNHMIETSHTDYSYKTILKIKNIAINDIGTYMCNISLNELIPLKEKYIHLEVADPEFPEIYESNLNGTIAMDLPERLILKCYISGIPKPIITWQKDNTELVMNNRTTLTENGQELEFKKTIESDEGSYKCLASNKVGTEFRTVDLYFNNKPSAKWMYVIIVVLATILVCCVVFLCYKIRREKLLRYELRKVGLENFEKGAVDSLNPDLGIDDQAELLPYDKKWEFPRDKLIFGKQLGSGAFGVVIKAVADGIIEGEDSTTVAVKMVKRNADAAYIRALASELKIMVHLGKHVNVVNLLGACTKNVAKRELLVIVEYCQFGNLQNYMFRHRENFIDQIDQSTGCLNFAIGSEILDDRSVSFSSNRSNSSSSKLPNLKYIALKFSKNSEQGGHINKMMADYRGSNYTGQSNQTESTVVTMSPTGTTDDQILTSNSSSSQPEWRSNYRGDYKDNNIQAICTKDLLSWAFQVARAMEYLASRKVLHGDLAARNILLSENNVVKICDFGLAKSMYKSGNYKKKGDGPLPVKWMAVESIRDRIFSTESDVWSFGIVLWEFFSLAKTPYPGMEADERLYQKLIDGYRMDSPTYATKDIYQMMLNCWDGKPMQRPSFTKLVDRIGTMLDESVKQHYIDLNDPYLVMNTHRLEDGQSDYLAMFTPPNFENLSSPQHYMNDVPNTEQVNGYMCMKPGQIFSPRETNQKNMFTFDGNNKLTDSESDTGVELVPMLKSPTEFDGNSETPESFSNPSYHILPNNSPNGEKTNILKSSDNYVNMPQNKSAIIHNSPEKCEPEKPYINSHTRDWERIQTP